MTYIPTPIEKLHFRIIHFTNGFNLKVVATKEHLFCVILSFLYPFRLNGNQSLQFKYNILNCLIKLIKKQNILTYMLQNQVTILECTTCIYF